MRVVVCVKQTPSTTAEFSVDGGVVSWKDVSGKPNVVNPWDEFAIEAGVQMKEKHGADVIALSLGDESVEEQLKFGLAMGCTEAHRVTDSAFDGSGAHGTAAILAAAVQHLGDVDLVICGKQAIDGDSGLTPVLLAKNLGYTSLTYVSAMTDVSDGKMTAERNFEQGIQVVQAQLPAVISVTKEIGEPRYPSFMGIRKANKATIPVISAAELGAIARAGTAAVDYSQISKEETVQTATEYFDGTPAEIATKLADKLFEEKII